MPRNSAQLLLFGVCLGLFQYGFFTSRQRLPDISIPAASTTPTPTSAHKRVFVFIVDALRLDFVTDNPSSFPFLHSLLSSSPRHSLLLNFRADAPTVTSQRLAALTTGTFPTFIDFTSNFDSAAVVEDNWVSQLAARSSPSSLAFFGDDTWMSLFPGNQTFGTAHPFDSFNTRDLSTVDDGIEENLFPFLFSGANWSLVVAHFLGVDHIGHTHSAHHPLLFERLERMDGLLQRVVELLPDDALLLFFGDHGMTNDGNHGGATKAETDAALFAYSPIPIFPPRNVAWGDEAEKEGFTTAQAKNTPRVVSQIDLAPTLSMLLGLPIPFSNIGGIIPEFFYEQIQRGEAGDLLQANKDQILSYLAKCGILPPPQANSDWAFLRQAKELGKTKWASFNLPLMLASASVLVVVAVYQMVRAGATQGSTTLLFVPMLLLLHAACAFSNSFITNEHWVCFGVVEALLLWRAVIAASDVEHDALVSVSSLVIPRLFLFPAAAAADDSQRESEEGVKVVAVVAWAIILVWCRPSLVRMRFPSSFRCRLRWLSLVFCLVARVSSRRILPLHHAVVGIALLDLFTTNNFYNTGRIHLALLLLLTTAGHTSVFLAAFVLHCLVSRFRRPWPAQHVFYFFLGRLVFFATSHRFDFGTLQLAAGFTVSDTFHFVSAGFFLAINTFGSDLLCSASSSAPCSHHALAGRLLIIAASCCSVLVLRWHLMIWDVFAPKLVFEVALFVPHLAVWLARQGQSLRLIRDL